jgi:PAS domain S-box-containing protein
MGHELTAELVQRRQLIREIEINKERMRLAAAAVGLGIWEWDVTGESIWVTESGRERLYLNESEVTTIDRFLQAVHPLDREQTRSAMSRFIESSGELAVEYRIIDPTGRVRWIAARGRKDPGLSGRTSIVRGISLDITEQREIAQKLRESEAQFRATFEQASVGIAHVAPDGTFLRVNQRFCEIVGYSREELLVRAFSDITSPDDLNASIEAAERLLQGKTAGFVTEKRYIRKDGSTVWVNLTSSLVRDSAGDPGWFVSVIQDVSKRKQAEEALRESERRLRQAQRIAHIGSWELDVKTYRYTFLADEVLRIYEVNPAEVEFTYKTFLSFLHPMDRETVDQRFEQAIETGTNSGGSFRLVMPDGRIKHLLSNYEILRSPEGEPLRAIGTIQDITERERATAERLQLRNELAHLARVTQLGELSTALAHEVNQPLGAIRNNASAARILIAGMEGSADDLDEILSDIISDASRAGQIIHSLRQLVRKQATESTILDINEVIQSAVRLFGQTFIIDRVTITLDLESNLPPIEGDRIGIEQVLMNLIMNAVESMRVSPTKKLKISSSLQSPDTIEVSVGDSGPGVAPEMAERVFKAFVTTKKDGLGLGLRICQSIVAEHEGRIWLDRGSAPGATFCFALPVCMEEST